MTLIGIKDEISEDLFNSNFIETVDYRGNKDFMLTKHGFELLQGKMRKWERKEQVQKFIAKYFKDEAKSQVIVCPSIPAAPIEELEKSEPPVISVPNNSDMELIRIRDDSERPVSARELHTFLEVRRDFTTWMKQRIEKYGFLENTDFVEEWNNPETGLL